MAIPAFAITVALASFGSVAGAQQRTDPSAVTVLGRDPNARRCNDLVMRGDITDGTVAQCTEALSYRHLTQAAQIQLRINRGVTLLRRQENEQALVDFDAVVALQPRHPEAQVNRGAALLQLRRYGPAIAAFTEALGIGRSGTVQGLLQ